ncbi:MAG: Ku protein [Thermodesulfobacteriota bacterium]
MSGGRAIWKGIIRLGTAAIPVKLYAAVHDRGVHFRLLHKTDLIPVQQEWVRPETGEVVPDEAIRHGVETADGRLVFITDEELQALESMASRDIEILRFVPEAVIDHRWHDRPYYLGPDGDEAAYCALAAALAGSAAQGLARWVMRGKEHLGVLRLRDRYPVLITLHHAGEVLPLPRLMPAAGREIDARELAMAEQLVAIMAGRFEHGQYRDEYRQRLVDLIAAKAGGQVIPLAPTAPPAEAQDLATVLAASLQAVQGRRHG